MTTGYDMGGYDGSLPSRDALSGPPPAGPPATARGLARCRSTFDHAAHGECPGRVDGTWVPVIGTGRFDVKSPDTEALRAKRALNDPIVDCCGRDAADCDCPPARPSTARSANGRALDQQHKVDIREGRTTAPTEQPYLTTLGTKVRPADSPDEAFNDAFNAGRNAVLQAARVTRNPLIGVLSGDDRQALIAIMNRAHADKSLKLKLAENTDGREMALSQLNQVTRIAHALGLAHDA